ncbi:MAG: hypothetical protein PHW45_04325 [Candidatus ainarchaeum sp.]|nr:hypothetical protein [Candidatus ainarchaeum sp.]
MVEETTILQHFIIKDFMLPFIFIFVLTFAILQKTKILGDGKKQLDAIVAAVLSLVFVSFAYPKIIVSNLILFLVVSIVLVFVGLLLWGFLVGDVAKLTISSTWLKWVVSIIIIISVLIAFLWGAGIKPEIASFLFNKSWSNDFWTSLAFLVVVAIMVAVVLKSGSSGGSSKS